MAIIWFKTKDRSPTDQHARGGDGEVVVRDQLRGGRPVHAGQLLLGQLVSVEGGGPGLDVHHVGGFFGFQEFDHLQAFVTFSQQNYLLVYKNIYCHNQLHFKQTDEKVGKIFTLHYLPGVAKQLANFDSI